jgi:hypothetical protein
MPEAATRRRRDRGMSAEEMRARFPSLTQLAGPPGKATQRAWVAVFAARPDAMHALLADYIKQVHATPGRIGQRPMPREEQVDFDSLVYGEENDRPLTEVLPELMPAGTRTFVRTLAMSRTQFQRILAGEYEPNVNELRMIAAAVGKSPTYFVEYRKAMAVAAFWNLLEERPGIATSLYRQYLEVRLGDR